MEEVMLYILLIVSVLGAGYGIYTGNLLISYPGLFFCVTGFWVWPQLDLLMRWDEFPDHIMISLITMILLCCVAVVAGFICARSFTKTSSRRGGPVVYSFEMLMTFVLSMGVIGAFSFYKMSELILSATEEHGGQWSGPITIYFFFAKLSFYAACIALSFYLISQKTAWLFCFWISIVPTLYSFVVYGKREAALSIGVLIFLVVRYKARYIPVRSLTVLIFIAGFVFSANIEKYRETVWAEDVGYTLAAINVKSVFDVFYPDHITLQKTPYELEMRNAAILLQSANFDHGYDYGLSMWGKIVSSILPAQLIGRKWIEAINSPATNTLANSGYDTKTGLTSSGFAGAYVSFSYFGALQFFMISLCVSTVILRGMTGEVKYLALAMALIPDAVLSVTHSTTGFFVALFFSLIFILLPIRAAQVTRNPASVQFQEGRDR